MSDILFKVNFHYSAPGVGELEVRERVEQALNKACSSLEDFQGTQYVGYKISEVIDLGEDK